MLYKHNLSDDYEVDKTIATKVKLDLKANIRIIGNVMVTRKFALKYHIQKRNSCIRFLNMLLTQTMRSNI